MTTKSEAGAPYPSHNLAVLGPASCAERQRGSQALAGLPSRSARIPAPCRASEIPTGSRRRPGMDAFSRGGKLIWLQRGSLAAGAFVLLILSSTILVFAVLIADWLIPPLAKLTSLLIHATVALGPAPHDVAISLLGPIDMPSSIAGAGTLFHGLLLAVLTIAITGAATMLVHALHRHRHHAHRHGRT